ncbi:unnamed protein product [Paramecium octaurelia]|uniref:Protein kinase domain-containing protein n=1 Tax=Paramecium octaurelia TaxID=43137 RepID=A0A8S1TQN5_PAROT|nr:unnamed protein product [Paramecium octaurelia]
MSQLNRSVKQIGQYQYNERHCLGEGAYGKVFQGTDIKTNEIVAIKKMDLALFERDTYLRNQIVSEIEILKKFNHPNIVRFIDLITTQRSLYIITELCKDGDLKEFIQKKRISEQETQGIMLQIINGFKELVKQGVIHRDLKPANILNHEGIVKIADFGFAKYVDNYTSQLLRSCVGSPLYMAPQILQRKTYSTKCDIWSIGVIFYEMVFHDVPWKGRDEQDLLKNILMKPLVFKHNGITDFTREFLTKALIVEESERIQWDQVFQMFESMEKGLVSNNPTLQKLYNDQNISWMQKQSQKMTGDQLCKQLVFLQQMKQDIAFRHFVNLELYQKLDQLKKIFRTDQSIEECILLLSRLVLAYSYLLVQLIEETCDSGEDMLIKGTKWNILNYTKNEQEYYRIFFTNCKDAFLKDQSQIDAEVNDVERNKLEENLTNKIIKIIGDSFDDLKKKAAEDTHNASLIAIELLLDQQIIHKNIVKITEVEVQQILGEKQQKEDWRKILERITSKWRQLQKL